MEIDEKKLKELKDELRAEMDDEVKREIDRANKRGDNVIIVSSGEPKKKKHGCLYYIVVAFILFALLAVVAGSGDGVKSKSTPKSPATQQESVQSGTDNAPKKQSILKKMMSN